MAGANLAFSPDGSRLVVNEGMQPAVQVWEVRVIRRRLAQLGLDWDPPIAPHPTGLVARAPEHAPAAAVRFDPGRFEEWMKDPRAVGRELLTGYDAELRSDPDFTDGYRQRGEVRASLGRHAEAVADYSESLRRGEGDPSFRPTLVRTLEMRARCTPPSATTAGPRPTLKVPCDSGRRRTPRVSDSHSPSTTRRGHS